MATGQISVRLYDKKLLGLADLKDRWFDYFRSNVEAVFARVWGNVPGLFAALDLDITVANAFSLDPVSFAALDGNGGYIVNTAADYTSNVTFENAGATSYEVGLLNVTIPTGVERNPRTGAAAYSANEEILGLLKTPTSILGYSGAGLSIRVDSLFQAGVSNSGRAVRVYLVTPQSAVPTVAFEDCYVTFAAGQNRITTTGRLGQGIPSSFVAADYRVALLGPIVTQGVGSLAAVEPLATYVGTVVGGGAGNPPASKDTSAQNVFASTGLGLLGEVVEVDAHGHAKICVKADASDANTPQISVKSTTGARLFTVDEDGDATLGDGTAATSPLLKLDGLAADLDLLVDAGVPTVRAVGADKDLHLLATGTGAAVVAARLRALSTLKIFDANAAAGVDFSSATDTAIDAALPSNVLGSINVMGEHVTALQWALSTVLLTGGLVSGEGAGTLNAPISAGFYLYDGRRYYKAGTTIALPDNATSYVYWNAATNAYAWTATITFSGTARVYLARVTTAGGGIAFGAIADLRAPANMLASRDEILVGPAGTDGAQFTTLGRALEYVREHLDPTTGTATRAFKIKLVGPVVETATPITIPCDGITIEGASTDPARPASLTWSGDTALIDLNAKSYLVFRDLALRASFSTAASGTGLDKRTAFTNTGLSQYCLWSNVRLENVGSDANSAHFFYSDSGAAPSALFDSKFEKCSTDFVANGGLDLVSCGRTTIVDCKFKSDHSLYNANFLSRCGVWVFDGGSVNVVRCSIDGFHDEGVKFQDGTDAVVDSNYVFNCGSYGILFGLSVGARGKITRNNVLGCATHFGAAQNAFAIACYFDDCAISDNYAGVVNAVPGAGFYVAGLYANANRITITGNNLVGIGGAATQNGVVFGAASNACIAAGNHFNARGITDLGGANLCDLLVANQP